MSSKVLVLPFILLVADLVLLLISMPIGITFGIYFTFLITIRALSSLKAKNLLFFSILPFFTIIIGLLFGRIGELISFIGFLLIPIEIVIVSIQRVKMKRVDKLG